MSHVKAWVYCYKIKQSTLIQSFIASDCLLAFVLTVTIELKNFLASY